MTVTDKRALGKGKSDINRKRFLDRHKASIKKSVDKLVRDRSIKDIANGTDISIKKKLLEEPEFQYDRRTGEHDIVLPGNKEYSPGDVIKKPSESPLGQRKGSPDVDPFDDDFVFTLSKDEFLDIYFQDMELPRFIKENLKQAIKFKYVQNGVVKHGNPARLHLKKTFEQAIARKIATRKRAPYLDDIDLRFRHLTKQPKPISKAVMFCLMDVSGSMGEFEKGLAKRFFILLYLFLFKTYKHVEIRFIRHTTDAEEVDEDTFFYSSETGGTVVSTGLNMINEIITKEYNIDDTNIYVAQASDGDNWDSDDDNCIEILENDLLPKVQYFAYIQVEDEATAEIKAANGLWDLYVLYEKIVSNYKNFNIKRIQAEKDVFPVLYDLFKKDTQ